MTTILCIDDNKTALYARKLVLASAGYSVLATEDVETAMRLFSRYSVDIVLCDYLLQGKTGTELAAEMKKLKPNVPVVILSGLSDIPDAEHVDLFLTKGESPTVVLQKLSELLAQR